MKNLLNFFLKYNYWFLFVLLEIISFALLFRFNSYQGSAFFTSANFVSGAMYDAANNVTGYFHLKTINDELVQKNVELELQLESIRKALIEATEDSSGVEQLKQEALAGYDIFKASVITLALNISYPASASCLSCSTPLLSSVASIKALRILSNCNSSSTFFCTNSSLIVFR